MSSPGKASSAWNTACTQWESATCSLEGRRELVLEVVLGKGRLECASRPWGRIPWRGRHRCVKGRMEGGQLKSLFHFPCHPGLLTAQATAALTHDSVLCVPGSALMEQRVPKPMRSLGPGSNVLGTPQGWASVPWSQLPSPLNSCPQSCIYIGFPPPGSLLRIMGTGPGCHQASSAHTP